MPSTYNEQKLTRLAALKALAQRTKGVTDALGTRIGVLEAAGSQANVLESVKVNGTALTITDKAVDVTVITGTADGTVAVNGSDVAVAGLAALAYKAEVAESDLDSTLATKLNGKADAATTLAGYGITDAYTKAEIDAQRSSAFKLSGDLAGSALTSSLLVAGNVGNVYNITSELSITSANEGLFCNLSDGQVVLAGDNVAVAQMPATYSAASGTAQTGVTYYSEAGGVYTVATVEDGDSVEGLYTQNAATYKFDKLSGFVDTSGFATTASLATPLAKLADIAEGATKVEASSTNGNVVINGTETTVYTHPTTTANAAAFKKVGNDANGHVVLGDAIVYTDLTALLDAVDSNTGYYVKVSDIATSTEVSDMLDDVFGTTSGE
jgi:hypothetical protein